MGLLTKKRHCESDCLVITSSEKFRNALALRQRRPLRIHQFDDAALGMIHHLQ
jgi:hypothetical protein